MGQSLEKVILQHTGRYRVTIRKALERAFLEGRSPSNDLQSLRSKGLFQQFSLNGNISCYQLTRSGAVQAGLKHPGKRSQPMSEGSLTNSVAALWFSFFGPTRRHRLELPELESALGLAPPTGVYCLEPGEIARIYRLYVPGLDTPDETIRRRVEERLERTQASQELASWARTRQLALAVLVSKDRRDSVNKLLKDLTRFMHILVEPVPHPSTLHEELRELGGDTEDSADVEEAS